MAWYGLVSWVVNRDKLRNVIDFVCANYNSTQNTNLWYHNSRLSNFKHVCFGKRASLEIGNPSTRALQPVDLWWTWIGGLNFKETGKPKSWYSLAVKGGNGKSPRHEFWKGQVIYKYWVGLCQWRGKTLWGSITWLKQEKVCWDHPTVSTSHASTASMYQNDHIWHPDFLPRPRANRVGLANPQCRSCC